MNDIIQRIRQLMEYYQLNISETALRIGVTQPNLSAILSGKRPLGENMINKFVLSFNINRDWLKFGNGEMLCPPPSEAPMIRTEKERFKMIRSSLELSIPEMAHVLKISSSTIKNIENGDIPVDDIIKQKMKNIFNINPLYIEGKAPRVYLPGGGLFDARRIAKDFKQNNKGSINDGITYLYPAKPFIDSVYAVCGVPSGFSIAIKEAECEKLSLPFIKEYDFSIKAKGDSMINRANPLRSIRDGDLVACRFWKSRSYTRWGEVYALVTVDGVAIKKIQQSEKEGHIKCVSFNEEEGFMPYDLPLEEIHDWAIVIGAVSIKNWN